MTTLAPLISLVVLIAVMYIVVRYIVTPIVRIIVGILTIAVLLFVAHYFFKLDINIIFGPLQPYLDNWGIDLNTIFSPLNAFVDRFLPFLKFGQEVLPE